MWPTNNMLNPHGQAALPWNYLGNGWRLKPTLGVFSNLPPGKSAFTEFQRTALIDLLETAVQMLKGPLVEKGLLRKLGEAAGEGASSAVKTGAELGTGFVLKRLWELLAQFLSGL